MAPNFVPVKALSGFTYLVNPDHVIMVVEASFGWSIMFDDHSSIAIKDEECRKLCDALGITPEG